LPEQESQKLHHNYTFIFRVKRGLPVAKLGKVKGSMFKSSKTIVTAGKPKRLGTYVNPSRTSSRFLGFKKPINRIPDYTVPSISNAMPNAHANSQNVFKKSSSNTIDFVIPKQRASSSINFAENTDSVKLVKGRTPSEGALNTGRSL
jgi:hypothetical protein